MPEMDLRPLGERMLRAGIAPRHVRRLLAELETHYAALVEEELALGQPPAAARSAARARLGSDDDIVNKTREQPSLRSWGARWPLAICGAAPVLGLLASAVLLMLALVAVFSVASPSGTPAPWFRGGTMLVGWSMLYGLPLAWAYAVARYGVARRLPWRWVLIGLILTASAGALTNFAVNWPHPGIQGAGVRGQLSAGFGLAGAGPAATWYPAAISATRWLITFVLGLALYVLLRRRLERSVTASLLMQRLPGCGMRRRQHLRHALAA